MLDFLNPVKGFGVTFTEMFRKVETVEYPEDRRPTAPRFHGHHQLNRWPDGLEKCIGCELCAWACPADAIYVEGRDNTSDGRFSPGERYGAVYQINYLRCILCGMCIEACPTRALTMTNEYEIADDSRENLIWTKEQLLVPLRPDMEAPPHPMRLRHEKDYYRLTQQPPTSKEGVAVPTPTRQDVRIGLALLQLLADAADSPLASHWVHRRVAQLEFLDTRAVRWRISVDFSVPQTAPCLDDSPLLLVPITRWRKSELVKVDFRDEQGTAIPLMTAEVTSRFMAAALYQWAADILRREKLPEPESGKIFTELSEIVSQAPAAKPKARLKAKPKAKADDKVKALLDKVSDGHPGIVQALFANKAFRSMLYELSENFVVLASVQNPPGTRRVFKLAFESRVAFQQPHGLRRTFWQLMGWRNWRLEVLLGGRGGSGHLEVAAPAGVDIVKIIAGPAMTPSKPGVKGRGKAAKVPAEIITPGKTPHVSIRVPAGARRYRAVIYLGVSLSGWLTASWLVAVVIAASMLAGLNKIEALFPKQPSSEAGTAATLLLALLGVFATYLIRPGEHPLAARLLRAARGLIMLDVAVVLVAVGELLLHSGQHPPATMWHSLTDGSAVVAALLGLSLLLPPWPWSKVAAKEAPHWESDVTPTDTKDVAQAPAGVSIQAPDGFSYGDEYSWGALDQRALVEQLTEVRAAAGF